MFALKKPGEPFWLDIPFGARLRLRPITVAMILVARDAAAKALQSAEHEATTLATVAFTRSLAQSGIIEWEGIGDADGEPIGPSPDAIDALLEHWQVFDAIDRLYVGPALITDAEKKGSSPAPNGTSAGAPAIARRAPKRARPVPTA